MKKQPLKWNKAIVKKMLGGWAIMLPSLILFAFFVWAPLLGNIKLSFYETSGFDAIKFNWFQNYIDVFNDPKFIAALGNTFKYLFWSIIIGFFIPIFLGLVLSEVVHAKGFFRIGLYFPSILSGIAVGILWTYVFDPNTHSMLNSVFQSIGIEPSKFLDDSKLVIPLIVVTMTWKGAGATVLIYLSALQTVDNSLYEAARLDGCGLFNRLRYVTLPHLWPNIKTLFILQIISVFQVFYEPLVMTGGGPNNSSLSLMQLSYNYAFDSTTQAGYSAATGVILAVIIIIITIIYFWVSSKQDKKGKVA